MKSSLNFSDLLLIHVCIVPLPEPVTMIVGEPEMYINKESTMNLTCVVLYSPEPPSTIYWTHDHEVRRRQDAILAFVRRIMEMTSAAKCKR